MNLPPFSIFRYGFSKNSPTTLLNHREVEGEGVVGVQPTLQPGERYQYVSGCNLRTEMGKMYGTYSMENLHNKQQFEVNIPMFEMIVPFKMN